MFKLLKRLLNNKPKQERSDEYPCADICLTCSCTDCYPNRCRALGIIK